MSRALKTDIPGPDWRVHPEELGEQGWLGIFGGLESLVVEIGFGRGEFLLELAARCPETAHVGFEVSHKRVVKMCRKLARSELSNVRIVELAAERAVGELFQPGEVSRFWVNFPDPWPKKRHADRRLVSPRMVKDMATRLAPGGAIDLATDHEGYAEIFRQVLSAEPLLENAYAPDAFRSEVEGRIQTGYELKWRADGREIHFFLYVRRPVDTVRAAP